MPPRKVSTFSKMMARAQKFGVNVAGLEYEELRQAFLAEQRRKLEEMGIHLVTRDGPRRFVVNPPMEFTLLKGDKAKTILTVHVYGVMSPTDQGWFYNVLFTHQEGALTQEGWREADVFLANLSPAAS